MKREGENKSNQCKNQGTGGRLARHRATDGKGADIRKKWNRERERK